MVTGTTTAGALFHERRRAPLWWWGVGLVIALPSIEIVVVFAPDMESHGGWLLALGAGLATVAAVAALLLAISRSDVEVDGSGLRADHAFLPAGVIGEVRVLDGATMRDVLGRDARADARISIKPWLHSGVQVEVRDPGEGTPYWVVATRRPAQLAGALGTLRPSGRGDDGVKTLE